MVALHKKYAMSNQPSCVGRPAAAGRYAICKFSSPLRQCFGLKLVTHDVYQVALMCNDLSGKGHWGYIYQLNQPSFPRRYCHSPKRTRDTSEFRVLWSGTVAFLAGLSLSKFDDSGSGSIPSQTDIMAAQGWMEPVPKESKTFFSNQNLGISGNVQP
jgi:hypothetical protein